MVTAQRTDKMKGVVARRQRDITVVLEDIFDPHNVEAIFRTCDAFGIQHVHIIFDTTEPFKPRKVGKATSSSANKWIDFTIWSKNSKLEMRNPEQAPIAQCLKKLKKEGYTIVATALTDKAIDLYEFKWPEKVALLVGNEHGGLSQEALELADYHVLIPMQGMVQSLNVSVSTAIFLSEMYRSRHGKDFSLPQKEQKELLEDFLSR
ncbi:MAG: RNA methyltransferase [Patescibacteria group bacterium]|jgi:tRNA (guanosine-2'-O-)-methyltransferase